jgi:cell volume regulation protein A
VILVSVTLLISYLASITYRITKIPDIILLMLFGITVGPILNLFDKSLFITLAPMMSIIALSIILFEAGINSDIVEIMQTMAKSTVLSISTILSITLVLGITLNFFMPNTFDLLKGMLLGAMVGGTSTVAVFGILEGLDKNLKIGTGKTILTMESIVSDPICIILSITLIRMIMLPGVSIRESVYNIFETFILSSLMGLGVGILWTRILDRMKNPSFIYMITISVLLPSYVLAERLIGEGGGAMAALAFGLAITNYRYIAEKIGLRREIKIDSRKLKEFHEEVTFFIKSFFFVYIGVVVSLKLEYIIIGFVLVGLIMIIRFQVADIIGKLFKMTVIERTLTQFIFAAGLPSFIMAQLPIIFDPSGNYFPNPGIYADLCMPIVLGTVAFSSFIGSYMIKKRL